MSGINFVIYILCMGLSGAGAWLVGSPDEALVFSGASDRVWEGALRGMGIDPVQLMHSGAVH